MILIGAAFCIANLIIPCVAMLILPQDWDVVIVKDYFSQHHNNCESPAVADRNLILFSSASLMEYFPVGFGIANARRRHCISFSAGES